MSSGSAGARLCIHVHICFLEDIDSPKSPGRLPGCSWGCAGWGSIALSFGGSGSCLGACGHISCLEPGGGAFGIVCQCVADSGTGVLLRILGWCLGVSQPMDLGASLGIFEGDWEGPLRSLLHNQAISPDTGLACRLRCVSNRHFLDTRRSTRWAEADFRATERRCGMRPDTHVRVLSTCLRHQGRLRDRRPPGGVDGHRHVWTLWEKRTHGTP